MLRYSIMMVAGLLFCAAAQGQSNGNVYDTIPFELIHDKIVIPAKVGGKPAKFILDTGGRNLMTIDSARHHGLDVTGQQAVSGVNSGRVDMLTAQMNDLELGAAMKFKSAPVLITSPNNFLRETGVAGLLGAEAFSQVCLTIDKVAGHIIISYPYRPTGLQRGDAIDITLSANSHPYVPVTMGGRELNVLFDTGVDGFFSLTEDDYQKIAGAGATTVQQGYGFLYVGIEGISAATPDRIERVRIQEMSFGAQNFTDVVTTTQKRGYSIMGLQLLDYGRIVLDFPRAKAYFLPYQDRPQSMEEATAGWNVKIMPIEGRFEITAVIGDAEVEFGEQVWQIGDTVLEGAPQSELYINRLLEAAQGKSCTIVVGKDRDSLRKVTINKI